MWIDWEPGLLEEGVLRTVAGCPEGRLFFRERERLYEVGDPEERAQAFDRLHAAWFARLELGRVLEQAVAEHPLVREGIGQCAVGRPLRRGDAGAELLVRPAEPGEPPDATRLLRILVTTETLVDRARAIPFFSRELQHVEDMLDPAFGYVPELPAPGGPGRQRLLRDRYRVIWAATVDGRLVRQGRLDPGVREARRVEFLGTFGWLGGGAEAAFESFFDAERPTHPAIAAFATTPGGPGSGAEVCPLCGCVTRELIHGATAFDATVRAEIAADFEAWRPDDGCCSQCAELYRARPLTRAGVAALPGIR